jgi:hypothetical protein
MLATDHNAALEAVIKTIQRAQMVIGEPDVDGHKAVLTAPLLKLAVSQLSDIYEAYKPKRGSKS